MSSSKKHAKVLSMLCLAALLLCVMPVGQLAYAAEYEPLTVTVPYKHVYTTTDTSVDSLCHYLLTPKDDAPLPAEADANGTFSFQGVSGSGEKVAEGTRYILDGELTFTFTQPGVYEYKLTKDEKADADKVAEGHYTLEWRAFDLTCYITNDPAGGMKLVMQIIEGEEGKSNDIELDPSYKKEETPPTPTPPTPTPSTSPIPLPTPEILPTPTPQPPVWWAPRTGDTNNIVLYVVLLSAAVIAVVVWTVIAKKQKGRSKQ